MLKAKEAKTLLDDYFGSVKGTLQRIEEEIKQKCVEGESGLMVFVKATVYNDVCLKLLEAGYSITRERSTTIEGLMYDMTLSISIRWGNPDKQEINFLGFDANFLRKN